MREIEPQKRTNWLRFSTVPDTTQFTSGLFKILLLQIQNFERFWKLLQRNFERCFESKILEIKIHYDALNQKKIQKTNL